MRPTQSSDHYDHRPRKSSLTDLAQAYERQNTAPTTFFLSRGPDGPKTTTDQAAPSHSSPEVVSSLQEAIDETGRRSKQPGPRVLDGQPRPSSRRRSTIKPVSAEPPRRRSSVAEQDRPHEYLDRATTPSPMPSNTASLPSSPKSVSSRSLQKSDEENNSDDAASQAIASSEDDEENQAAAIQDSQPELIMPSIKMPSRRPFTDRGKRMGRFKIMVAGHKGSGKTSLIKSIVQVCEDIVHVDPLSPNSAPMQNTVGSTARLTRQPQLAITEIYASTKPYPSWWSDLEESRVLRRRKSMGDFVLERNLCFVDTSSSTKLEHIIRYVEQQLATAMTSVSAAGHDFASLLSGRGGSQVDVLLYLISKDNLKEDKDRIQQLSQLTNVIPLIARSDLLSAEEQRILKQEVDAASSALPRLPATAPFDVENTTITTAPYTITSINGPDLDTMDASLLMSPEYIQPLLPSELAFLIQQLFDNETISFLRHTSAKKVLAWHANHPRLVRTPSPSLPSGQNSTLASPFPVSLSNSGVLVPPGPGSASDLSLTTSNSYALARVADHSQREERLAQIRLSKWASDLQLSLQRERERYERLARNERAVWLIERMGQEVRDGQVVPFDHSKNDAVLKMSGSHVQGLKGPMYQHQMHDPLGLLQWRDSMRTRGWITLQVVGSFGVVGGLAFWLAKTWGFTHSFNDWAQEWSEYWFGMNE